MKVPLNISVEGLAPKGCRLIAADVFWSDGSGHCDSERPVAVFCFPGGGMSRHYYDLPIAGYSFAAHLAAMGCLVVTVDHPGIGGSDVPDDPWELTPEVVADVDAVAVEGILDALRSGTVPGIPALAPSMALGVGHSAGALVVLHQQARRRSFDALALLGWSSHGLPEYLDEGQKDLANRPDRLSGELVDACRRRYQEALIDLPRGSSSMLMANTLDPHVHDALVEARSRLLAVIGYASMIPGSAAQATEAITVPVFLGVGDRDIATRHRSLPAEFPRSDDLTLFVLPNAGHNHNVEPGRAALWNRLAAWAWAVGATGRRLAW